MATPKLRDLDSYVKTSGAPCTTCASEHRTFIEQASKAGYDIAAVARYLNEQFDAGLVASAIRRHFREGHDAKTTNAKRS